MTHNSEQNAIDMSDVCVCINDHFYVVLLIKRCTEILFFLVLFSMYE